MAYPIVRTDLMMGTNNESLLRTFKYLPGGTPTAINNGCVVLLDSILLNSDDIVEDREVWKAVTPAATSALKDIVLVATPELMADERKKNLSAFCYEADALCRGYILHENDIFSVTSDGFDTALDSVTVGSVVELAASNKMSIAASLTSGSTQVGKIIQVETVGSNTYYVVRVC